MARIFDVVEYPSEMMDEIVHPFPEAGTADLRLGSQVIVRDSQRAVFVRNGKALDVLGPGRHTISTANIPYLISEMGWAFNDRTPFTSEICFVSLREFMDRKWGCPQPIYLGNPTSGYIGVGPFGSYAYRVNDPQLLVGNCGGRIRTADIENQLRSILITNLTQALHDYSRDSRLPVMDIINRPKEIAAKVFGYSLDEFAKLGLQLTNFSIVSIPILKDTEGVLKFLSVNDESPQKITQVDPVKILFLASNPSDTPRLRLDEEYREIDKALLETKFREHFEFIIQLAVRTTDLQGHLLRYNPDIVHFSGHGSTTSEIILENNQGFMAAVPSLELSRLFAVLKDNIRCVVLNACYSKEQAEAIAENIECVIGMSKAIGDTASANFAKSFYQGLGYGRSIKTAFELGCIAIGIHSAMDRNAPVLISHSDPDKIFLLRK